MSVNSPQELEKVHQMAESASRQVDDQAATKVERELKEAQAPITKTSDVAMDGTNAEEEARITRIVQAKADLERATAKVAESEKAAEKADGTPRG